MNKQFLYILTAFISGYTVNQICTLIIKPAQAYEECNCSYYDFSSDIDIAIDSALRRKISSYDYNFRSAVENIAEDCHADEYGDISC